MSQINLNDLFAKLRSKTFSDPSHGDLFYNFYMYQYPASAEYELREKLLELKDKLIRPADFIDTLALNVFDEFCDYLKGIEFGDEDPSLLDYLLRTDNEAPDEVHETLNQLADGDEFIQYLDARIQEHIEKQDAVHKRPYIFLYGIGQMYPYLRANTLLTKYEPLNRSNAYKIILFYPGTKDDTRFRLFGLLNDDHTYRAHLLINDED